MATMGPDEQVFRSHMERGPFQSGVARGRWRLVSIDWPHALIGVNAAARDGGPGEYVFRFDCSDYPASAPTAQPWDLESGTPLEHKRWPTGRSRVPLAFNPNWNPQALYLPCDRLAMPGHDPWREQHPQMVWSPAGDITQYIRIVHELLNSTDYTGPRGA